MLLPMVIVPPVSSFQPPYVHYNQFLLGKGHKLCFKDQFVRDVKEIITETE
jgi:hypothetical protein